MKKILLTFAVIRVAASAPAIAQKVAYACQHVASGGLFWKHGEWILSETTKKQPFF